MCVGMCALSSGFNCLIRAYSQLHGYSHDTNTQSAGQWRTWSRAVATQNTGRGDTNHGNRRRKTQAVATQNTGSGNAKYRQWRRKTQAVATRNHGPRRRKTQAVAKHNIRSGETKHGQWRHKTQDRMCFRGPSDGGSSTVHRRMSCTSKIHTIERQI